MGGREEMAPLLVGLGLDEISVAGPMVPAMKAAIGRTDSVAGREVLDLACRQMDRAEVSRVLAEAAADQVSLPILDIKIAALDSDASSRAEVIKEMVDRLYLAGRVSDPDTVEEAIWLREDVYSTGVGYGFAIPHCKSSAVLANSVGILRLKNPVEWKTLDGEPVHMAVMLAIREADQDDTHLRIFARLARKIMHEDFRERLMSEEKVEPLMEYLTEVLDEGNAQN
jgi:fructose-specific PTS system IIA-like component